MESYKTFIKHNRAILIGHILIYAQGMILMPIIIKTVGVTVYGGYILIFALLGFIYGISSLGVGFKCCRFLPGSEEKDARRALFYPQFYFNFLSIVFLSLLFILFYPYLDRILFKSELIFSRWLVFPYLFSYFLFSQIAGYFLSTHRVQHFNYATIAFPYINIGLIALVYFIKHKLSVNILFFTQVLSYILLIIPLSVLFIREIGLKFILTDLKNLIDDIKLGFPLRINYIMDFLLGSSDRYLIAYFITVAAVGYYSPAYAIGSLIIFFPKASSVVLVPLLSKAIDKGDKIEAYNMLNYTIKGFLLLAIPFAIGSAMLSGPLLNLFANFEVSQKAYMVTPIVAAATVFFGLNIILSNLFWVRMKTSVILKMNALAVVVNLVLNVICLHVFKNILVAAFTTLISYLTAFIFIRREAIKEWPICFAPGIILKSIGASLVMGIVLYLMAVYLGSRVYKIGFILSEIFVAVTAYIITLLAMKTFSNGELKYLKSIFS